MKILKKIVPILMSILILLSVFCFSASADTVPTGGLPVGMNIPSTNLAYWVFYKISYSNTSGKSTDLYVLAESEDALGLCYGGNFDDIRYIQNKCLYNHHSRMYCSLFYDGIQQQANVDGNPFWVDGGIKTMPYNVSYYGQLGDSPSPGFWTIPGSLSNPVITFLSSNVPIYQENSESPYGGIGFGSSLQAPQVDIFTTMPGNFVTGIDGGVAALNNYYPDFKNPNKLQYCAAMVAYCPSDNTLDTVCMFSSEPIFIGINPNVPTLCSRPISLNTYLYLPSERYLVYEHIGQADTPSQDIPKNGTTVKVADYLLNSSVSVGTNVSYSAVFQQMSVSSEPDFHGWDEQIEYSNVKLYNDVLTGHLMGSSRAPDLSGGENPLFTPLNPLYDQTAPVSDNNGDALPSVNNNDPVGQPGQGNAPNTDIWAQFDITKPSTWFSPFINLFVEVGSSIINAVSPVTNVISSCISWLPAGLSSLLVFGIAIVVILRILGR